MDTKLIIGIVILIICCVLAFLIPLSPPGSNIKNDCEGGICPPPTERRVNNMDWYWIVAILAALAGLYYWFFVR